VSYEPLTKKFLKKFKKRLDKRVKMCYNKYSEREVITMTRFNDNWFDVMFDEAVEALEKEENGEE
jgi:hypothetical protein